MTRNASSPCPPPDYPAYISWGIPVVLVAAYTIVSGVLTLWIFRRNLKRVIVESMFLVNLSLEAGVAMRVQFTHTEEETKRNCIITTVSSGLALLCMVWDNYETYKTLVPLRRFWYLYRHLTKHDIARLCLQLMQLGFRLAETLLRYKLRNRIPKFIRESDLSVIPLVLAMATWTTRLLDNQQRTVDSLNFVVIGDVHEGQGQQQGIAAANAGADGAINAGADAANAGQLHVVVEGANAGAEGANAGADGAINAGADAANAGQLHVVVEGANAGAEGANAGQAANPIPSPLLDGILGINNPNPVYNLKCFDHWSTIVDTSKGRKTLNMWQLREINTVAVTNWKLPAADFIVLHFSLINRASYDNVITTWIPFLKLRAPNVRIILVGTEKNERDLRVINPANQLLIVTSREGTRLALRARAVAYEECDCGNMEHQRRLVNTLVELVV